MVHYTFETDSIEYRVSEYNGNVETYYTPRDTILRIFNAIDYYTDSTYYHYMKDHLGNICAVVNSETSTPVQRTTYYASGVPMAENLGPDVPPSLYYAMGVQYTENFGRDEQPYLYNGKEFIEAHGLNEYDSQARMYYAPIMRTTTMDLFAENYYHISPYAWCGNNPIAFVDTDGDSIAFYQINKFDETYKTSIAQNVITDLETLTGLSISMNEGLLSYAKDEDGNPIIFGDGGSETARNQLISLIDASQMVKVSVGNESFTLGNEIVIAPKQIEGFIDGSFGVDSRTMGYGMIFLHESYHTSAGGGLSDAPFSPGPVVEKMNIIRQEMNKIGYNFGQRMTYYSIPMHGLEYLSFNSSAQGAVNAGLLPCTLFRQQYIHFPQKRNRK